MRSEAGLYPAASAGNRTACRERAPRNILRISATKGFKTYYPNPTPEIEQRLEYELEVIEKTQFANYFLVVWDMLSFARKKDILVGVRGSAAASIVLHCLGITAVDPIEHKLVFERFLNIERKEMPDIDSDFEDYRRQEVIDYVSQKYGADHVAQIITFGTLGARAALRDVGRALGMSYGDVDRVARLVPFGVGMTLDRAMEENAELKQIYQADAIIRKLVDSAKKVEGISRHASTHAAGIVISKEPLARHVPLQQVSKGEGQRPGDDPVFHGQYRQDRPAENGLSGAGQPDHSGQSQRNYPARPRASTLIYIICRWMIKRPSICWRPVKRPGCSNWKARACAGISKN